MPLNVIRGLIRGARRGNMTSKRGNRTFYKGRGAKSTGYHTSKGNFIVQKQKVPEFVVPDLTGFQLRPYVSYKTPKIKCSPLTVQDFLAHVNKNSDSNESSV
eukprot:m.308445 g.308445  ORF g.308445 m.308445 type:complete len:102 (+) comp44015_c0_seq1:50-355(+)